MSPRSVKDEPDELELSLYRRLLAYPDRWWSEVDLYYHQPARARSIRDALEDGDWLRQDEDGRLQLTEAGKGALTWIVKTHGREHGLVGTFFREGGTAAWLRLRSRFGKRHSF